VAILPVTRNREASFEGQEYLGIYPYMDEAPAKKSTVEEIWVNKGSTASRRWGTWISDPRAFRKTA
jgi:hypothetical protein